MTKETTEENKAKSEEDDAQAENLDPTQLALKYKAFSHIFTSRDVKKGLNHKVLLQKLKKSKKLEETYVDYLEGVKGDLDDNKMFPWDSPYRRFFFLLRIWLPTISKYGFGFLVLLFIFNYMPGPTQHIVELVVARTIYDTSRGIERLPLSLESYAHSAKIVDAQGSVIKTYGKRQVTQVIPDKVKRVLLACEDHYFLPHARNPWYINAFLIHPGVSWFNLAGAVKDSLSGHVRGASTIVMQNAKKILGNRKRTIANKLEEIVVAYLMVSRFGKERNIDFYINTVPVGSNIYGFPAAARNYFRHNVADLNEQQLAAIGSFIPNHNRQRAFYQIVQGKNFNELSPSMLRHAKSAINKVNLALTFLHDRGEITDDDYANWQLFDEESIRRIGFRGFSSPLYGEEEWATWNVIREVCSRTYKVGERTVSGAQLVLDERGDVVIETGVNLDLVEQIKSVVGEFLSSDHFKQVLRSRNINTWQKDLAQYKDRNIVPPFHDFEGFMKYLYRHINVGVVMVNQDAEIVAYVGGKEFFQGENDETESDDDDEPKIIIDLMNRQATIPPSSTVKPVIAYYAMVAANADLQTTYADEPMEYKYVAAAGKEVWLPRNWYGYDKRGTGLNRYMGKKYNLLEAQVLSVNTIFARLYTNRSVQNSMLSGLDKIGLKYNREDARYWPFGIGASDVPVRPWLGVYNAFLDGYYRQPTFVKRITVDGKTVYDRRNDPDRQPVQLFDSKQERQNEMFALYEVCNRGSGASMKTEFKYHQNLVSGKTGTAPNGQSALFISHFNPYRIRQSHSNNNMTMIVALKTNTGGIKSVGTSTQGPTIIAGRIYDYMFRKELQTMMDEKIEEAKKNDPHFRDNHLYWANVNRYMERLLNGEYKGAKIYEHIDGVDGFREAIEQILNSNNKIYAGRDDLFEQLVQYYCDQDRVVKMRVIGAGDKLKRKPSGH
ncbi:MAG: transglycosylase domain-containing protein [Desulfobulbaceae bacterium]|nr:transglycosylase domain-containing protein [Desulfobulbaceae bacterium]